MKKRLILSVVLLILIVPISWGHEKDVPIVYGISPSVNEYDVDLRDSDLTYMDNQN